MYTIEATQGGALVEHDGKITLGDPAHATRWKITRDERRQALLIEQDGTANGWALDEVEPWAPVTVRPLIVFPTEPPTHPDNELWHAHPVDQTTDTTDTTVVTITTAINGWQVVPDGSYTPHLVAVPETFAPVTYVIKKTDD
ncbi:I66 family serine proteinase inhibitor [Saccharothrix violaceirubra]|uniref:Uncharacterized protein n=1 Tax=Saccharothrix violaceirubra TaxID=413306 RepID=A0A7W7T3P0_9PSEU|nr:I66 family serine proteinase inhibitor [Saccharothrix violaceirubra]MBB4965949.1 hypothetical protein [Saccharothrix violaceirubra]